MASLQILAAVACLVQPPTPQTESPLVGPGRSLRPRPTQQPTEPTPEVETPAPAAPSSEMSSTSEPEHPAPTPEPTSLAVEAPEPTAAADESESIEFPPQLPPQVPPLQAPPLQASPEEFSRAGGFAGLSAGISNCSQPDCFDIVMAGLGRIEFGYRFGVTALVFSTSVGGAPLSLASDLVGVRGRAVFVDVGGGIQISPVRKGRVDPFVGVKLGYTYLGWSLTNGVDRGAAWYSRGFVGFTTGLNIFVTKFAAIGPRFDYLIPFAGKVCSQDPTMDSCSSIKDLVNEGQDAFEKRGIRRSFAQPWSLTANLVFVFGS